MVSKVIIEAITYIEYLSQTWYKDFDKCVKKYLSKEYNPYLNSQPERRVSGNREIVGKNDILKCISTEDDID